MITKTKPVITMSTKEYEILDMFAKNLQTYCNKQDSCPNCRLCNIMQHGFDSGMDAEALLEDLLDNNIIEIKD
jgi:hypothetical protein